eukprot:14986740-Alexandrium_andersonii.AAC.1
MFITGGCAVALVLLHRRKVSWAGLKDQPVNNRPRAAVDVDALRPQSHVLPVRRLMRRRALPAYE